MPTITIDVTKVTSLLAESAEAVARTLLMPALAPGFAGEGTQPDEYVPAEGCRAIAARMTGLDGTLIIALSTSVVNQLLSGPLGTGTQDLVMICEPALRAAGGVLDNAAPRQLRMDSWREVDPAATITAAAWEFMGVPLFEGEEHRASLVVLLDDPASVDTSAPVSATFDELATPEQQFTHSPDSVPMQNNQNSGNSNNSTSPAMSSVFGASSSASLRLIHDVEMDVTVELGRTRMTVRNILSLIPGSVIELDRAAGAPVDLLVNGTLVGRGEVVVIDEEFGVRISEIVSRVDD
jgi:flagellar motor switch protein FliN